MGEIFTSAYSSEGPVACVGAVKPLLCSVSALAAGQ